MLTKLSRERAMYGSTEAKESEEDLGATLGMIGGG